MIIGKSSYKYMPFFLKILTAYALAGFLFVFFAVWKIIAGHAVLPSMIMAISGLYFGICGISFLVRWKYAREIYLGIFFIYAMLLLITGANLFMFFGLFMMVLPITLYLYKRNSVSNYFSLEKRAD